ncbi:uncharacterized protein LOC143057490 [Mytilus galloprovincialis]|uniref:uncharacterized protein LOC143057490 n=1 Tax=Mytilus galloprovincialis TaxID=29158 RepID=UPI003F7C28F0
MSVCFETHGDCRYKFDILNGVRIPEQPCSWSDDFVIPGFRIDNWMSDKGLSSSLKQLPPILTSQLLEDLDLADYLLNPTCDQSADKYKTDHNHGWNSECATNVTLPDLPDSITCHLDNTCTGFSCCADIEFIDRNVNIFLTIDPCNYKLNIGIEKYQFEFFLMDFEFGIEKQFHIGKVIEVRFLINDLSTEQEYAISMTASVCLESNGTCQEFHILDRIRVPKPVCNWDKGFKIQDFSLSKYMSEKGLIQLNQMAVLDVLETLGVSSYLKSPSCDRYTAPFTVDNNGWSNGFESSWMTTQQFHVQNALCC